MRSYMIRLSQIFKTIRINEILIFQKNIDKSYSFYIILPLGMTASLIIVMIPFLMKYPSVSLAASSTPSTFMI